MPRVATPPHCSLQHFFHFLRAFMTQREHFYQKITLLDSPAWQALTGDARNSPDWAFPQDHQHETGVSLWGQPIPKAFLDVSAVIQDTDCLLPLKSPLNILNILDLSWKDSCNTILQSLGKKDKTKPKTNEQTKPHHHQNNLTTKQKTAFWEENQNAAPLGIWKTAQNRDHKTAYMIVRVTTCVQSSLQLLNLSC